MFSFFQSFLLSEDVGILHRVFIRVLLSRLLLLLPPPPLKAKAYISKWSALKGGTYRKPFKQFSFCASGSPGKVFPGFLVVISVSVLLLPRHFMPLSMLCYILSLFTVVQSKLFLFRSFCTNRFREKQSPPSCRYSYPASFLFAEGSCRFLGPGVAPDCFQYILSCADWSQLSPSLMSLLLSSTQTSPPLLFRSSSRRPAS